MPPKYVTCPAGHRNDRIGGRRKCLECGLPLRKRRVPKHAEVLRDTSYEAWERESQRVHGGEPGACAMCRKPRPDSYKHDRDHDHRAGSVRGLLCVHCNRELARNHTLETARALVAYLERCEAARVVDSLHREIEKGSWSTDAA